MQDKEVKISNLLVFISGTKRNLCLSGLINGLDSDAVLKPWT